MKKVSLIFIMFLSVFTYGCDNSTQTVKNKNVSTESEKQAEIVGEVWYRERILLPPNTQLLLTLEDVSKQDVASTVIAKKQMTVSSAPPWRFTLAYDASKIDEQHRYALRARVEVDGKLRFINTSHIPAFDKEGSKEASIMVSSVGQNNKVDQSATPDSTLENTYWRLVRLADKPVVTGEGKQEINMTFRGENNGVSGFSGCNRFSGVYELSDDSLIFKPLMSTQMACHNEGNLESAFLMALGETSSFKINGEILTLKDNTGRALMNFKAIYL